MNRLFDVIQNVVDCLVLENMQRPSFTFRRIYELSKVFIEYKDREPMPICPYCKQEMKLSFHNGLEEDNFAFWECNCMDYELKSKMAKRTI